MPDFTFTSPEGKNYTVTGPEGATKEQAFEVLQQQLKAGTAKEDGGSAGGAPASAAKPNMQSPQMNPQQGAQPQATGGDYGNGKTFAGIARDLGVSTGVGAVAGAFSPEILTGAGAGLVALSPVTGPAAPLVAGAGTAMAVAGRAMRGARVAEAAIGALSGFTSEATGQAAEAAGASKGEATAARLAGGVAAGPMAGAIKDFVAPVAGKAWNLVQKVLSSDTGESVSKAVQAARGKLSATNDAVPQHDLHAELAKGVAADIKAADAAADAHIREAQQRANDIAQSNPDAARRAMEEANTYAAKLRADARNRAQVLDKATDGKLKNAAQVQAQADVRLKPIGNAETTPSDIGTQIRDKVVKTQDVAYKQRQAAYNEVKQTRDAAVAAKESQGIFIDSLPETRALKDELATKLLNTKAGRAAAGGKATVTDQGQLSAYQKVYDAISNRRVQSGIDPETGNPTYQTFKTTFEAIDAVRRKLGDAAFGEAKEGYEALGQKAAKDMYGKLSKIQEAYAGDSQKVLQETYSGMSEGLSKFKGAAGKRVTAMDRLDPEAFAKDPATLAPSFFKSQQGVRDLYELTGGDSGLVTKLGGDYLAQQLRGKSSAQVAKYLSDPKNRDWMQEIPGLGAKGQQYVKDLQKIERVGGKLEQRAKDLQAERQATIAGGEKQAQAEIEAGRKTAKERIESRVEEAATIQKEANKTAEDIRSTAQKKAQELLGKGYPEEETRRLLMTGDRQTLSEVASKLSANPRGSKILEDSVRNVLKNASPASMEKQWQERLLPMLRDGKLVPADKLAKLEKDVQAVIDASKGKQVNKVKMAERIQRAVVATLAGQASARAADSKYGE